MKATRFLVSGLVQGVGFRFFARRSARSLGLVGFARNLADGRVEVVAAGPEDAMRQLQEVIAKGPAGALVDRVQSSEATLDEGTGAFEIRH